MATGYYLEWGEKSRMVHMELFDGPIEDYMNNPDYKVTPFEVPDKEA